MPVDYAEIQRKLILQLRANLVDPNNRLNQKTETFSGDDIETTFELTQDLVAGNHTVKHIDSITIDGSPQTFIGDYNYYVSGSNAGKIIFNIAPVSGTNNISITYSLGSSSWIYEDYPRHDLKLTDYPRIGIPILSGTTIIDGIGGSEFVSEAIFSLTVFAPKKSQVKDILKEARDFIINNSKTIVKPDFIYPSSISRMGLDPSRVDQINQQSIDLRVPNICDLIT